MRYHEIHAALRQALGCYEGFRRLGFSADDLFFIYASKQLELFCVLRTQGKEFSINCGPMRVTQKQYEAMSYNATVAVNDGDMPEEDLQRIWTESFVYQQPLECMLRIKAKGIVIPKEEEVKQKREEEGLTMSVDVPPKKKPKRRKK